MKKEIEYRMTDILVVDDDSKDLETIREGLRLYPKRFNLITANNGKKVKEIIRTVMVDVVILDACMLGKDDPDLMRSLQKLQNSFPTTHVII